MTVMPVTIEMLLAQLVADERARGDVAEEIAETASSAAARTFADFRGRILTAHDRRRVSAYFRAVVRRRLIRGRASRHAASRAVLHAVVADLRSAGCSSARIAEELARGWRGQVPDDLLEEVRLQLVS